MHFLYVTSKACWFPRSFTQFSVQKFAPPTRPEWERNELQFKRKLTYDFMTVKLENNPEPEQRCIKTVQKYRKGHITYKPFYHIKERNTGTF